MSTPTLLTPQPRSAVQAQAQARAIVHRTRGTTHGPITRLMSPGDLGELLKPFVFLDLVEFKAKAGQRGFGMHPHSGLATLTVLFQGDAVYEDTTGKSGLLPAGGVEWMHSGNGVWHSGAPAQGGAVVGFQLWVALPPNQENVPAHSLYLAPSEIPDVGPARVLLGRYGGAQSPIPAPSDMTYLAVRLRAGERWTYTPAVAHDVAWLAMNAGQLDTTESVSAGEMVLFEESNQKIDIVAQQDSSFVIGSALKHPYELVTGFYSVHTSPSALALGEAGIQRVGLALQRAGRLR